MKEEKKKPKLVTKTAYELVMGWPSALAHDYGGIWKKERKRGYKSKYFVRDGTKTDMGEI